MLGKAWSHSEKSIAGNDGGELVVAPGDERMEIFICGWTQRFEAKIVDDQQRHASEGCELALVGAGGAGGIEARGEQRSW